MGVTALMQTIGFVGLGTMGLPMAKNILKSHQQLVAYDVNIERLRMLQNEFEEVQVASSLSEVASRSDVVITMLPTPQIVSKVVSGEDGILNAMSHGSVWIDMSTIAPLVTQELSRQAREHGIRPVDAPVGRTSKHAETGTLVVMAGGEEAVVEEVRPLLHTMAEHIFYCGLSGMGQSMKVVNNLLAAVILAADAEALVLGVKSGLNLKTMLNIFKKTGAYNAYLDTGLKEKAFQRDFTPGFMVALAEKDVGLASGMAEHLKVPLFYGSLVRQQLTTLVAQGKGEEDISALVTLLEQITDVLISTN